jgi:hypothetical protein
VAYNGPLALHIHRNLRLLRGGLKLNQQKSTRSGGGVEKAELYSDAPVLKEDDML